EGVGHDLETANRWRTAIAKERAVLESDLATRIDAITMATIYLVNEHPDRCRVRLITRSVAMHKAFESERRWWQNRGGSPLRHPRAFIPLAIRRAAGAQDIADDLERVAASLDVFVSAGRRRANEAVGREESRSAHERAIRDRVEAIRREW